MPTIPNDLKGTIPDNIKNKWNDLSEKLQVYIIYCVSNPLTLDNNNDELEAYEDAINKDIPLIPVRIGDTTEILDLATILDMTLNPLDGQPFSISNIKPATDIRDALEKHANKAEEKNDLSSSNLNVNQSIRSSNNNNNAHINKAATQLDEYYNSYILPYHMQILEILPKLLSPSMAAQTMYESSRAEMKSDNETVNMEILDAFKKQQEVYFKKEYTKLDEKVRNINEATPDDKKIWEILRARKKALSQYERNAVGINNLNNNNNVIQPDNNNNNNATDNKFDNVNDNINTVIHKAPKINPNNNDNNNKPRKEKVWINMEGMNDVENVDNNNNNNNNIPSPPTLFRQRAFPINSNNNDSKQDAIIFNKNEDPDLANVRIALMNYAKQQGTKVGERALDFMMGYAKCKNDKDRSQMIKQLIDNNNPQDSALIKVVSKAMNTKQSSENSENKTYRKG